MIQILSSIIQDISAQGIQHSVPDGTPSGDDTDMGALRDAIAAAMVA